MGYVTGCFGLQIEMAVQWSVRKSEVLSSVWISMNHKMQDEDISDPTIVELHKWSQNFWSSNLETTFVNGVLPVLKGYECRPYSWLSFIEITPGSSCVLSCIVKQLSRLWDILFPIAWLFLNIHTEVMLCKYGHDRTLLTPQIHLMINWYCLCVTFHISVMFSCMDNCEVELSAGRKKTKYTSQIDIHAPRVINVLHETYLVDVKVWCVWE